MRRRDEIIILSVRQIGSIVADSELLHIVTLQNERYTISYRLHLLESKLDPRKFVRLGRGAIAALDQIQRVSSMPGGNYQVTLADGQELPVSPCAIAGVAPRRFCAFRLLFPRRRILQTPLRD